MNKKTITLYCADDYPLTGTLYIPDKVNAAIIMAPATGIKRTFYNSFSSFLAEQGYGVLSFDNRGIGDSKIGKVKHSNASIIDWGRLDMSAAFKRLQKEFPNQKYHLIGHSAGGQLVGIMKESQKLTSIFNYACSSGSIRNMNMPFKFQAHFFMNFFIPLNNLLFGKTNSQWVGMGEPLPKQVGQQWRRWCNGKGYIETDFGKAVKEHHYDELTMPSLWLYATDDPIANLKNVKDMARVYSKSNSEIISLSPSDHGLKEIGHMKFFSSKNKSLWNFALNWLDKFQ